MFLHKVFKFLFFGFYYSRFYNDGKFYHYREDGVSVENRKRYSELLNSCRGEAKRRINSRFGGCPTPSCLIEDKK